MTGSKTLRFHAVLFAAAVAAAATTWTRDIVPESERGRVLAWERDTADVVSVRLRNDEIDVEVQRRIDDDGAFLWGVQVTGPEWVDTLEFPTGAPARTLVGRVAAMRVVRDLGELSPERRTRFGLDEPWGRLSVGFRDGLREFSLGDSTFASSDRYALEGATGVGYVVPGDVVNPLRIGQGALRERWLHRFQSTDVAAVRLTGPAGARTVNRGESGEWLSPESGEADAAFANFMQRVDQLAIAGYGDVPTADALTSLLTLEYVDAEGDRLGFVELLKSETAADGEAYFVRSETTRVAARAVGTLAARVEQGMSEAF